MGYINFAYIQDGIWSGSFAHDFDNYFIQALCLQVLGLQPETFKIHLSTAPANHIF